MEYWESYVLQVAAAVALSWYERGWGKNWGLVVGLELVLVLKRVLL